MAAIYTRQSYIMAVAKKLLANQKQIIHTIAIHFLTFHTEQINSIFIHIRARY